MEKRKAYLLALSYTVKNGKTYVSLLVKGKKTTRLYYQYDPYFLVDAPLAEKENLKKITGMNKAGKRISPKDVEVAERIIGLEKKKLLKMICNEPSDVPALKHSVPYPCYEFEIPFSKRFLLDMQLTPTWLISYEREGKLIKKITACKPATPQLSSLAFDIETYNPLGTPRPKKDPVLIISYADGKGGKDSGRGAITYKKCNVKGAEVVDSEREMFERFSEIVKKQDPDVLFGYNSGTFDLPYLQERSKAIKAGFNLGRWKGSLRTSKRGMVTATNISDRLHIDIYPIIRLFGFIGVLKTAEYTLNAVAGEVLGKRKMPVSKDDIWRMWDADKINELVEYAIVDAELAKALGETYLPLELELSSITKMQVFDAGLATSGQFVENLLMFNSAKRNELIPQKPVGDTVNEREMNPIQGAFVKLPEPGIYENIAVLDFRGLYPSIIISYNIDPAMLIEDEEGAKKRQDFFESPTGARFRKSPKGLIPTVLDELVEFRSKLKKQIKSAKPGSDEYRVLSARSQAIKIISNSAYGYTAYARSRWYSRKCAESVTAWGRKHIQDTMDSAEKKGFHLLYGDTDSIMIIYKSKKEVLAFMEEINKALPEKMELELEGFYPRGVFVSKKTKEGKGAKKKYALLGEDDRIKIRGFELVRRDWSRIAKDTQYRVLEAILKDGSQEKALAIVKDAINRIKSGKVSMDDLKIVTQLNKDPKEGYAVTSPELAAAKKLIAHGTAVEKGSVIAYVITKQGKSISEKAVPAALAKDYDPDYYINNQILPSVMKILKELGHDEYGMKVGGKQKSLDSFFG